MSKKIISSLALLAAGQLFAAEPKPPNPLPYDYDLFRRDKEIIFLNTEFLYWSVQESGVDYAQKMAHPVPSGSTYANGHVHSATYLIDPGLRVGIGYFNAPKYWEGSGQYTHFISRGKDRVEPPTGADQYLTGTWPQITSSDLTHAHSDIFFDYNLVDVMVDRVYITNPHFRMKLQSALSMVWMHQDWKVQYFDSGGLATTIRNRWRYTGGGLKIGFSGDWYWGNNIYLTGFTGTGLFMGSYRNRAQQNSPASAEFLRNSDFTDARPAVSLQFMIGPSWQQNFTSNRVVLFTGYEINGWFNVHEVRHSTSSSTPSADRETWIDTSMLALYGLTTRLSIDF